jgi:hypothetical protein
MVGMEPRAGRRASPAGPASLYRNVRAALAVVVAMPVLFGLVPSSAARALPERVQARGHREVVVRTDGVRFWPVSQRVVDDPLPVRDPALAPGLRVLGLDSSARVVYETSVGNPLDVLVDVYDGERLGGGSVRIPEAHVVVPVPIDVEVAELVVSGRGGPVRMRVPQPIEAAGAPELASATLRSNGPVGQRIDVTFLGDGYTAAEMDRYRTDVAAMDAYLFSQAPFSQYERFFNVHRVDVVSAQSGTDDTCAGTSVNTALGTAYYSTGVDCRLLWTNRDDLVRAAAASAPAADVVVVIVNTERYGGGAQYGGYSVFYRGAHAGEVMLHELGHSFGLLADEYDETGGRTYTGPEPTFRNLTTNTDRATTKWRGWINPATPLPTPVTAARQDDVPGLYEGATFGTRGIYRPTYSSKMRTLYRAFERVDHSLLTLRMFELLPDDATSATGSATVVGTAGDGSVDVRLTYADAESHVHSYQLSNYADFRDSARLPASNAPTFDTTVRWIPLPGPGVKTVYVRIVNGAGERTNQSFTVAVGGDLVRNGGFEEDGNGDGAPDSWTTDARFRRSSASVAGGAWSGRHRATNNSGYTIAQSVTGLRAGTAYTAAVSVNIPATADAFTFRVLVQWQRSDGSVISTTTVGTWSAATPWVRASRTQVAPTGTTRARVRMVTSSLNATIYVDNLALTG